MVPEISDRIVEIDRAMRWGYANQLGPFELWDALGFEDTVERIEAEGRAIARRTSSACSRPARQSFYRAADRDGAARTRSTSISTPRSIDELEPRPGILVLADLKRARGVVKKNAGASLIDLGDGVLCLRVPQQDEHARRRHDRDDARRPRRDRAAISRPWSSPTRARTSASART